MSYIILNGVKNTSIQGLTIQTLPSISKPQIRTSIETIDGRDGDIVTKLGYSSYDKSVLIGLHGNFNIDEVIEYFNSEGTVTFSDEPDKYYKYQIFDRINFDRIIRYRQATVSLHVQPFKYSLLEGNTEYPIKNGSEIQINNSGNIFSKPTLTLTGTGTCGVYLNNTQAFSIALGVNDTITIDTEAMEAYKGTTLKNRAVTGSYDKFYLPVGNNVIRFSGSVTLCSIKNYSRWI